MKRLMNAMVVATLLVALPALLSLAGIESSETALVTTVSAAALDDVQATAATASFGRTTVRGHYGFTVTGTQFLPPASPVQVVSVGFVDFANDGTFVGADVISVEGEIIPRTLTGSYSVEPNCTLAMTIEIQSGMPGSTFHFAGVITGKGKEILLVQTDPGSMFTGSLKR